jgi:hypothetical protein
MRIRRASSFAFRLWRQLTAERSYPLHLLRRLSGLSLQTFCYLAWMHVWTKKFRDMRLSDTEGHPIE